MKLIPVIINGKIHRLSERAMELLNLEKQSKKERPIELQKLPPDLSILKIEKKEIKPVEQKAEPVVEVKKKEVVIVESTEEDKPKRRRRNGRSLGTEK